MHPHHAPQAFQPAARPATVPCRDTAPQPATLLRIILLAALLALLPACATPTLAEPVPASTPFPDIPLENAASPDQLAALGLSGQGPWKLSDIRPPGMKNAGKAPLVLIEIFSMYCPHCQREAPHMNRFAELLAASPLKDRIAVIGVGAGNTRMEVDLFRERYGVTIPLFADPDLAVHEQVGEPGTPHFFLVSLKNRTAPATLFSRTGRMASPQSFLDELAAIAKRAN
ncbi:TlpA family protein disulfide reductase [Nitratidesulfovibrio sp. HK-II]|uniref:peroxiredoxin family protein n=1 Tax=Nitratidesulfovibrio sp. HK-II TaxID=2009266 RepID=UPI000E2F899A|nr:TlpA disulfide reductase family protein [Nitratidesulfovibrio sp. HK-II]